jgi:putative ABC transport system permease protein
MTTDRQSPDASPDPSTVRRDVDDELEFHVRRLADKHERAGLPPDEARRRAVLEFGNRAGAAAACVDIDRARLDQARRSAWLEHFGRDVWQGARRLRQSPTFTVVTVLTLALGIGPLIAVFSLLNSALLRPLPFPQASDLVVVQETYPGPNGVFGRGSVSYPNYLDWRAQSSTLSLGAAGYPTSANLQDPGGPERLSVAALDADVLPMLGIQPSLGRNFLPAEAAANGPAVVILSDAFWRRRYNAAPDILGRTLVLDDVAQTVVGIMPPEVTYPGRGPAVDVWRPLQASTDPSTRNQHFLFVMGRLKSGQTVEHATADLKQIAATLATRFPAAQEKRSVALTPYTDYLVGRSRPQLLVLFGAAGFVLLIAAANAASLLLARAGTRQRDIAVLTALGASRGRVVQQFLVESLLLSAVGALLGFALSGLAVRGIVDLAGTTLPRGTLVQNDWRVVSFVALTMVATTILFGIVPALRASRTNAQDALRDAGRGGTGGRERSLFRNALVVGQFALSLVLLTGAGLMMRTLASLLSTSTGMTTTHVLTLRLPVPVGSPRYPTPAEAVARFYQPMLAGVRAVPGVEAAGLINLLPLQQSGTNGNFGVVGKAYGSVSDQPFAEFRVVGPGYFATLGIPVLHGRDVTDADVNASPPVVLVNDAAARQLFPHEEAVGRQLSFGTVSASNPAVTIVGVVGSVRQARLESPPAAELYFPTGQAGRQLANMSLVVRVAGDPTLAARAVEAAILAVDRFQPVYGVATMTAVVEQSIADRELYFSLLAAFAGIALLLAMAGIYGVIAYSVTQRTREFGIRLALGSDLGAVQRIVVWQGGRLALLGLAIGVPAAYLLAGVLSAVLYGVTAADPATFATVAVGLACVSLLASYFPARRVLRVDPITAMRAE